MNAVAWAQNYAMVNRREMMRLIIDAYKDIDTVMANQSDLVVVVHSLKQIICVKG